MNDMVVDSYLREQLVDRRQRLERVLAGSPQATDLGRLLEEVDSALERMDRGTYGICEFCHEPVEKERLIADPLVCFCIDHLTPGQRSALERDLELAAQMQRELLPPQNLDFAGWEVYYRYEPLGPVSGDYCDLVMQEKSGDLFFILGDASGKGVTASMVMTHLHAIFRTLISTGSVLDEMVARAGRIFSESKMSPYFATLVCGRASPFGKMEICNAGHCPPLLLQGGKLTRLEASGLPLGLFDEVTYSLQALQLGRGDLLFLYTDGLSEGRNPSDDEYGEVRVCELVSERHSLAPQALVDACLDDATAFRSGAPRADDLTLMAIRRSV